jgi:hypothetical protein
MPISLPDFEQLVARYQNTAEHNDELYRQLTAETWANPLLARHRRHIEEKKLGFGDPAFHALWLLLLEAASRRFTAVRALEIGVFKGQIISLWSLLAREDQLDVRVSALGPLRGQPAPRSRLATWLRYRLSPAFREKVDNANFYADEDYAAVVQELFAHFQLDFSAVRFHRGFSTDPAILHALADDTFHLIYVDGDHTYEGALHDLRTFGPKVVLGGWLVADDAGRDLPGSAFWKGHEAVSRAVAELPGLGFKNILNVGHNRVFERIAPPAKA